MRKNILPGFILILLCVHNISGQEIRKNTLYGGISASLSTLGLWPGLNIEYERTLNDMFSVSIRAGTDIAILPYAEVIMRLFPWQRTFFAGLGATTMLFVFPIMISPGIGWKIDVGAQDRWVIMPSITIPMLPVRVREHWFIRTNISIGYRF